MKRVFYGFVLMIAGLFLYLPAGMAQPDTGPRIVIEEKAFDAREVKEGTRIQHTFLVKNSGNEALEIRKVSPG